MKKTVIAIPVALLILIFTAARQKPAITYFSNLEMTHYSYLALGDSYTIGESILLTESFPYQAVQTLRRQGYQFGPPEIVAKTGWTTDELQAAIGRHSFLPSYDFVTLLIGVNNQYRGRSPQEYLPEFESLLKQAINFAGDRNDHVIVISIPDWGVTPYAEGRDQKQIAKEIDEYNAANRVISEKHKVQYIDITQGTREAANDRSFLASDGLHPSAKEYQRWSDRLTDKIKAVIQ